MKLINTEFDHERMNDCLYDKKGRVRRVRHNRYDIDALDFEDAEFELENTIRDVYHNERNNEPRKCGMRKRYRNGTLHVDWWDERPGGAGRDGYDIIDNQIHGLIRKYKGKKFNDCFAALKSRVKNNPDWKVQACGFGSSRKKKAMVWFAYRKRFLACFEDDCWKYGRRYLPDYTVDDNGIIHIVKRKSSKKIHQKCEKRKRCKKPDRSVEFDRSLWLQKHEYRQNEFGWHDLMTHTHEELRRNSLIGEINAIIDAPYRYIPIFGYPSKDLLIRTVRAIYESGWIEKRAKQPVWNPEYELHCQILIELDGKV